MIDVVGPFCLSKHDISFPHMFPNAVIQPRQKSYFVRVVVGMHFSIIDRNVLVQFSADSSTSLVNTAFQSTSWSILHAFAKSALSFNQTRRDFETFCL